MENYIIRNSKKITITNIEQLNHNDREELYFLCEKCKELSHVAYRQKNQFDHGFICKVCRRKATKLEKYGDENYTNRTQARESYLANDEDTKKLIRQKIKATKLEKYGDENYTNRTQARETCLERYGVETGFQTQKNREVVRVAVKREDVIKNETDRVLWYLKNYDRYEKLGYSDILNLPANIDFKNYTRESVEKVVEENYLKNQINYEVYAKELLETWNNMSKKMVKTMQELYGFISLDNFTVAPTLYGTGGGSLEKGGVIFFKIPIDRSRERTTAERITHEVLAHGITASLREGTEIDESISSSHQWHKERLMDLLGRTLLVRTGILKREEVKMDGDVEHEVASIIDPIYYLNLENPNENSLRHNGGVKNLFKAVVEKIKTSDSSVSEKIEKKML